MTQDYAPSIIKELFNFRGYRVCGFEVTCNSVVILTKKTRKTCECPKCGKKRVRFDIDYKRRIRDLNLGNRKCFIVFKERKVDCRCGFRGVEKLDFVDKYSHYTKRFEDYVSKLCQLMSLKDVAEAVEIDWKAVKRIDKKYLSRLVTGLESISPTKLGIDEISYRKGHKYLTVVRDLELGRVIWVGMGRNRKTLDRFFKELGRRKCKWVRVVVLDMHDPYIVSVRKNTKADIVFDKFHIAKKITEALDKVRRQEFAKADPELKKKFKKKRFIILKRGKRLGKKKRETLQDLMRENERLYKAYLLKEQALDILDEEEEYVALVRLYKWLDNVMEAGIAQLEKVANMITSYLYGIANYFRHRLTNAASEGFNNKINVIKRRAYGFHDIEYFMLKILQSCGRRS